MSGIEKHPIAVARLGIPRHCIGEATIVTVPSVRELVPSFAPDARETAEERNQSAPGAPDVAFVSAYALRPSTIWYRNSLKDSRRLEVALTEKTEEESHPAAPRACGQSHRTQRANLYSSGTKNASLEEVRG